MSYAPFAVQNPGQPPANVRPPGTVDEMRVHRRQQLFYEVESTFTASLAPYQSAKAREKNPNASMAHTDIYRRAFSLVADHEARKAFNLGGESAGLLREYGTAGNFGRGCLLARRLVEGGVTCVEVDLGNWDNHMKIFPTLKDTLLPQLDKGMGTLVKDLVDRGRWENTVVVWMGEFGRTPRINQNGGRDHWTRCWSVVVGGGAIKGGQVYGSTNKDGTEVASNACSVGDLFATLYKALGIDPASTLQDPSGRPHGISGDNGKPIEALT
jgi:hypothetical protein